MGKKFRGLFAGIFLLAVVLMMGFIFGVSYDVAPSTAEAGNTKSMLIFNVTNTSATGCGTDCNNLTLITLSVLGNANYDNVTSVNISDGVNDYSNGSITGSVVTIDVSNLQIIAETNLTVSFTFSSSAKYGVTLGAQVTAITNETNISYSAVPYTGSNLTLTETTNPTATAACTDIYRAQDFACTCSGTDVGATASGVSTSVGTSTAGSIIDTSVPGGYTYTCTVTDVAGNVGAATKLYQVRSYGVQSGGSGSSSGAVVDPTQKKITLTKITPGVAMIIKNFDPELGVKKISIEVNNEVRNIKVTVTKHDGKPAAVSKERSGKVYQYFEVDAPGLENNIARVTMRIKVMKTWVLSEKLEKEAVLVFKFDEVAKEWKELATAYVEDDDTYYYYDVELDSFSYFAIGVKSLVEETAETAKDTAKDLAAKSNWTWYVALILLAGLAAWYFFFRKK